MIPSRRRRQLECYLHVALQGTIKKWNYLETKGLAGCSPQRGAWAYPQTRGTKRRFEFWLRQRNGVAEAFWGGLRWLRAGDIKRSGVSGNGTGVVWYSGDVRRRVWM